MCLCDTCFHVISTYAVRAYRKRILFFKKIVLGMILSYESLYLIVLFKLDILDGMRSDESVLTDHERKSYIGMLSDTVCLKIVIIYFLVVLGVDLDESGITLSHGVGIVVIDVDGTGKGTACNG